MTKMKLRVVRNEDGDGEGWWWLLWWQLVIKDWAGGWVAVAIGVWPIYISACERVGYYKILSNTLPGDCSTLTASIIQCALLKYATPCTKVDRDIDWKFQSLGGNHRIQLVTSMWSFYQRGTQSDAQLKWHFLPELSCFARTRKKQTKNVPLFNPTNPLASDAGDLCLRCTKHTLLWPLEWFWGEASTNDRGGCNDHAVRLCPITKMWNSV